MKSKNPHSGCRQVEVSKTLDTTDPNPSKNQGGIAIVQKAYSIENHPADSRVDIDTSGKVQTLTGRMGTGGGNVPMVMEPIVFDGSNVTCPTNASNPKSGDPCHTLSTDSRNYVVYESHPMDSRIKELDGVSPTVSVKWHKGAADTPLVCEEKPVYCLQGNGIDRADTAGCNGKGWCEDVSYTLNTIDRPAVTFAMQGFGDYKESNVASGLKARDYKDATDLVTENSVAPATGVDCWNATESAETTGALQARSAHNINSNNVVRVRYIVRRLTPTECARLQGFADQWGEIEEKKNFTDEEYRFWLDVRNTHAAINGKAVKDYTKQQMLTWYNKLHTDSAEYKMWGNGIALPPALYCMQGIADVLNNN